MSLDRSVLAAVTVWNGASERFNLTPERAVFAAGWVISVVAAFRAVQYAMRESGR